MAAAALEVVRCGVWASNMIDTGADAPSSNPFFYCFCRNHGVEGFCSWRHDDNVSKYNVLNINKKLTRGTGL